MAELTTMAVGAMQQQLIHIQQMQRDHGEMLRDLRDAIDRLNLKPPPKESSWPKLSPKMWLGLVVAGLSALQTLPLEQGLKILGKLF